ncbi:hypothetical protein AYO46_02270 [Betaproteobacteria bacterium SCGC AG-212-J23]|nr:hypothetical protein AYO46_02270 [Betaproteobacteria bacterium SCGC AG-212-J23]
MLGVVALVGVLGYNYLQERSARRQAERSFASRHEDVLLEKTDARREPTLRPEPQPGAIPHPQVDYIIEVSLPLREGWTAIEHRFGRRALLTESSAALQMVTRDGVVSEAELLEFRSEVETLASRAGATARSPEMRAALEAAQELDRACADADIQIAVHVIGGSGEVSASASFQVARREDGLTFTLDVARTAEPSRSYEAMVRAAKQCGGNLIDDNGRPLDDRTLAAIGAQIEAVRQELLGRGIEPGGPLAQRLFS